MLIIDGVKYEAWIPPNEDEFEQVVKEHTQDIFGEQSVYLGRKQKLKSLSGIGSIPDGYVIVFGDSPEWHIVEVELSSHPLYEHIVSQISKFINGISNPNVQRGIVNAMDNEITKDDFLRLRLKRAVEPTEIYKFLSDLISKQPILTIIIEKDTEELREALTTLRYSQIKVVEFRTFIREGVGLGVHAHLFEPLYRAPPSPPAIDIPDKRDSIRLTVWPASRGRLNIPKEAMHFFPDYGEPFVVLTHLGTFNIRLYKQKDGNDHFHLNKYYKAHPEVKRGDVVTLHVREHKKRYLL